MIVQEDIIRTDIRSVIDRDIPWRLLSGKTVLVAGATGMLGNYLVRTLLSLNEEPFNESITVVGLVRNKKLAESKLAILIDNAKFHLVVQDVIEPIHWDGSIDYIIHTASIASPKYFGTNPVETITGNVLGTYNLLELARVKGADGFLFISSGEVYGESSPGEGLVKESDYGYLDPLALRSCYPESKKMAETMCISWMHQYGLDVKIARPFHSYGPGLKLTDGRVFADFVADIVQKRDIVVKSDGRAVRNFCYISDTTAALFTILFRGVSGQAYNVCNEKEQITISELANLIVSSYPELGLQVKYTHRTKDSLYMESTVGKHCPSMQKLLQLGWQPLVSLKEGFRRTIDSFINDF